MSFRSGLVDILEIFVPMKLSKANIYFFAFSGKEFSLNAQVGEDGDEWQDWLVDKELDHDLKFAHQEEMKQRQNLLKDSLKILNEREKEILYSRRLNDEPTTLEDLSKKYQISRERIRPRT